MAFEESNAQIEVMDGLFSQASAIKSLLIANPLLNDARYAQARSTLREVACLLVQAQDEIGAVKSLKD